MNNDKRERERARERKREREVEGENFHFFVSLLNKSYEEECVIYDK